MSCQKRILQHLQAGNKITPLEALQSYGTIRLGAYIHELRKAGYNIRTNIIRTFSGKTYAEYVMITDNNKEAV